MTADPSVDNASAGITYRFLFTGSLSYLLACASTPQTFDPFCFGTVARSVAVEASENASPLFKKQLR